MADTSGHHSGAPAIRPWARLMALLRLERRDVWTILAFALLLLTRIAAKPRAGA